jgi:hypothetical protein
MVLVNAVAEKRLKGKDISLYMVELKQITCRTFHFGIYTRQ